MPWLLNMISMLLLNNRRTNTEGKAVTQYIISLATNVLSSINLINIYSDDINQVVFVLFCNYVRYVIFYGHLNKK